MNILITGANGYLAKNLVKKLILKSNHNLILLVRENSNINELMQYVSIDNIIFYNGRIDCLQKLHNFQIDIIFHLANYYPDSNRPAIKKEIISSNITLIKNIIKFLGENNNIRIINITSYIIFDKHIDSLYKDAKKSIYEYLSKKNCQNFVLYDTYGNNDPRPKLINYLIDYSKNGKKLKMKYSKDSEINLVYIKDVINAFMVAIEKEQNTEVCKICCKTITLKNVIDTFNEISEKKVEVEWLEENNKKSLYPLDFKRLSGWKPKYNLAMGLTEMLK